MIEDIVIGLNVDIDQINDLITKFGQLETARILGSKVNDYDNLQLAGRLLLHHYKSQTPQIIKDYIEEMGLKLRPEISEFFLKNEEKYQVALEQGLVNDLDFDWFSADAMIKTYCAFDGQRLIETPQFVWLRVATELYFRSGIDQVIECYFELSKGYYTPATPTLLNAGKSKNQMASCFLLSIDDSLKSILGKGVFHAGMISRGNGGLGIDISRVRHSEIKNAGISRGIIPMLRVIDTLVEYVDQCFSPDTLILTNKGFIQIKHLVAGDEVLTDQGFSTIFQVLPHNYRGPAIAYSTSITPPNQESMVTNEHELLIAPNLEDIGQGYDQSNNKGSSWNKASEMKIGNYVAYPIKNLPQVDQIYNLEDCYIFGRIVREGCHYGDISLPKEDRIIQYLQNNGIKYELFNGRVEWDPVFPFRLNQKLWFSQYNTIIHSSMIQLPENKLVAILEGLFDFVPNQEQKEDQVVEITNDNLYSSLTIILLKLRVNFQWISSRSCSEKTRLIIKKDPPIISDDKIWVPVTEITKHLNYSSYVYDLRIDQNRNYTTISGLAHNGATRKGAATIFLRTHHIDVIDFVSLPRHVGDKYTRAHSIHVCLWTSWLFWKRVEQDDSWTLFCPALTPQLNDLYGVEFERVYETLEKDLTIPSHCRKVIRARELLNAITESQRDCGMPYLMNGDACNLKSNQRNLGYIRCSNLCLEIIEYSDKKNISSCNLHNLNLSMYSLKKYSGSTGNDLESISKELRECVDFKLLEKMVRKCVHNLNNVIDYNKYPLDKKSQPGIVNITNKKHRPIGLGVAGLADLLAKIDLHLNHHSMELLNKMLFGCIYWSCLLESVNLSIQKGPYDSYKGSPFSKGLLQFDLWKEESELLGLNKLRDPDDDIPIDPSLWGQDKLELLNGDVVNNNWDDLKRVIKLYGIRNSLLTALMPTATTANVRRVCETVEVHQNNLYLRQVMKGGYICLNRYLVSDLKELKLWNSSTLNYLTKTRGSIQGFSNFVIKNDEYREFLNIPDWNRLKYIEKKYVTMWEVSQKVILKLAAQRGRYIDQSQSTNIYLRDPNDEILGAMHSYSNKLGLKTMMYYLRQAASPTVNFASNSQEMKKIETVCGDEVCTACS